MSSWTISTHARTRMTEMAVSEDEVLDAVVEPEIDYPTERYGAHNRNAKKGRICVAYDEVDRTVITVLWNVFGNDSFARGDDAESESADDGMADNIDDDDMADNPAAHQAGRGREGRGPEAEVRF